MSAKQIHIHTNKSNLQRAETQQQQQQQQHSTTTTITALATTTTTTAAWDKRTLCHRVITFSTNIVDTFKDKVLLRTFEL